MAIRTYYDPLHQGIELDDKLIEEEMVINLIDSSPFQRLRRIKQLGPASLTFHGAESTRFSHSIGVFHIARKALCSSFQVLNLGTFPILPGSQVLDLGRFSRFPGAQVSNLDRSLLLSRSQVPIGPPKGIEVRDFN